MTHFFYHSFYWFVFFLSAILHFVVGMLCFLSLSPRQNHRKLTKFFIKVIAKSMQLRVNVNGINHIPKDKPCIIMANHASLIDIMVMFMAIPYHFNFISKKELLWVPFIGFGLLVEGDFLIDRNNPKKAKACIKKVERAIKKGRTILMFPEGTRSATDQLLPFKRGGFKLAANSGAAIIPAYIQGSNKIVPKKSLKASPGLVTIYFLPPIIPTEDSSNDAVSALSEQTAASIKEAQIKYT